MGTWGTRIYEDDLALNIRGEFLEQYRRGVKVPDIEQAIKTNYFEDSDTNDVAVLALCCVELEIGALTSTTKKQALEVIESGRQPKRWLEEAGKTEAGLRAHELSLIKRYIKNYVGKPVRRRSWVELQRDDKTSLDDIAAGDTGEKLDDADWHEFKPEGEIDDETYMAQAAAHIAGFAYWLVTRHYYQTPDGAPEKLEEELVAGKCSPAKFLDQAMDGKLLTVNAKPDLRGFLAAYYEGGRHFYMDDYAEVVLKDRKEYSFVPTNAEYDKLAARLDERLADYRREPYEAAGDLAAAAVSRRSWRPWVILLIIMLLGLAIRYIIKP